MSITLLSATKWQPYVSPGQRPGLPNGAAPMDVRNSQRIFARSRYDDRSAPLGLDDGSDSINHPGRWPGLSWSRPVGAKITHFPNTV